MTTPIDPATDAAAQPDPSPAGRPKPPAEARILHAALVLFGRNGYGATSVRTLAREAQVSPALVLHYFGSKEGLRAEVERFALDRLSVCFGAVPDVAAWQSGFQALLEIEPETVNFLGRVLLEPGEVGTELFDRLFEWAQALVDRMSDDGLILESADPHAELLAVLCMNLGPMVLQDHVRRHLSGQGPGGAGQRYASAVTELLSRGFFRPG